MTNQPCGVWADDKQSSGGYEMPSQIVTVWPAVEKKRDNQPTVLTSMITAAAIVVGIWMMVGELQKRR